MHNLPKNNINDDGYPILSAQNINNGLINYKSNRYVDYSTFINERKRTNIELNDVLLTIVATIGRTAIVKEDNNFLLQRSVCVLKPNKNICSKFLKYCLDVNKVQKYMNDNAHGSAQAGIYLNQVKKIIIPLPSLEKQNQIVELLDKFDLYCNDIMQGLPAEIEKRKQQYEYYRNKLLTFKQI